jgi:type IV secretion system protein VirB11
MEQLISEATQAPMQTMIAEAVDLIVPIAKTATGRRIEEILIVEGYENGHYIVKPME